MLCTNSKYLVQQLKNEMIEENLGANEVLRKYLPEEQLAVVKIENKKKKMRCSLKSVDMTERPVISVPSCLNCKIYLRAHFNTSRAKLFNWLAVKGLAFLI